MTTYTDAFGGSTIYPSEVTYRAVALAADVTLHWPEETSASGDFVTKIMDVTPSAGSLVMTMPLATGTSNGNTVLFNNVGAFNFIVKDSAGVQLISIAAGTVWQLYLTNNTTDAGTWKALQYGAATSSANASALAGTGIEAVGTLLSQSVPVTSFSISYSAGATDRAKMFVFTGAGGQTLTLPAAATVGNNWFMLLRNSGSDAVTVDPSGGPTIDGSATLSMQPTESAIIVCDGTNYYTVGFGQTSTFAFDYTTIAVAGAEGNYTLAGAELNRIAYAFTGALTGNRDIIVPATVQQYWVSNDSTGAYTFTVRTAAGTGVALASGQKAIFYCDGVNVVDADSSTVSLPMAVNQGGTSAITAGAALINLGGTSVGTALFTAATAAAAYAALGVAPAGVVVGGTF